MIVKKRLIIICLLGLALLMAGCSSPSPGEEHQTDAPANEELTEAAPATEEQEPAAETEQETETPTEAARESTWQDDFSDLNSGWERYREFDGVLDYLESEGVYQMQVQAEDSLWWVSKGDMPSDLEMTVDVKQVDGPDGSLFGLMCRYSPETYKGYVFLISNEGQAGVGLSEQGFNPLPGGELKDFDVINTGLNATNMIEVHCVGELLKMAVNGETLFELIVSDPLGSDIGLVVATTAGPGADVYFDNLLLWDMGLY